MSNTISVQVFIGGEFAPSYEIISTVADIPQRGDVLKLRVGGKDVFLTVCERALSYFSTASDAAYARPRDAYTLIIDGCELRCKTQEQMRGEALEHMQTKVQEATEESKREAARMLDAARQAVEDYHARTGEQDEERARLDQQAADYDANPPQAVDMSDATRQAVDEVRAAGEELRRQGYLQ